MKKIATIWVFVLLSVGSMAAGWQQQWRKATNFYIQKKYDSAAYYYELVAATRPQNAEVYYNLGNTYYRLNKIAPAVLNYERALHTDPTYREAQDNLAITQARISHQINVAEEIFFVAWWHSATTSTTATTWAIVALACFLLALGAWWARRYVAAGARLPVQLPGIFGFVSMCAMIFGFAAAANSAAPHKAVVFENDTPLMNSQQMKGKPAALLPEGTTLGIISEAGDWMRVRLPDSRTGWVRVAMVSKV
jgi:hypothetical protein